MCGQVARGVHNFSMGNSLSAALQVMGKVFELIALLATESSKLSKKDAFTAITGLVDKMSDMKLKGPAGEALTAMSEALGPQFIFTQLHKRAAAQKNPKVCFSMRSLCFALACKTLCPTEDICLLVPLLQIMQMSATLA